MKQMNLFGEEIPTVAKTADVIITKSRKDELSKGQKAFNRYSKKVDSLRREIARATDILDECLAFYGEKIAPLERQLAEKRAELLDLLFPYLDNGTKFNDRDKAVLIEMLSNLLDNVWCCRPDLEERHKEMFKVLEGITWEQADEVQADLLREELESIFGANGMDVDLSDLDVRDREQVARKLRELAEERGEDPFRPKQRERKKTKKQLEAEARAEAMEKARKQSLTSIYRQLAKALHPDLEQNDTLRAEKEELMKQLTTAYEANDLHTLLTIETQWVRKNNDNIQNLTDDKVEIFNQVLKEQVAELEDELWRVYAHPRYAPIQPFGMGSLLGIKYGVEQAVPSMHRQMAAVDKSIANLKGRAPIGELRLLIKQSRSIWWARDEAFPPEW